MLSSTESARTNIPSIELKISGVSNLSTNIPTPRPNAFNMGILFLGEGVLDVNDSHTENSLVLNLPPESGVKGLLRFPGDLMY